MNAREIVKMASEEALKGLGEGEVESWLRLDENGTWESEARGWIEKALEKGYPDNAETEMIIANYLYLNAMQAVLVMRSRK
jgi:hypothetical protein